MIKRSLFPFLLLLPLCQLPTRGGQIWQSANGNNTVYLNPTMKGTGLVTRTPYDPDSVSRWQTTGLGRLRLDLSGQRGLSWNWKLAYEQWGRMIYHENAEATGNAFLPAATQPFYRIEPLNWQLAKDNDGTWRHEIDRAMVAYRANWGNLTVGRQAVGLGRGTIFSAVDLFAPFAPTEVDREWRRGIDAARLEYQLTPVQSIEALAIFGENIDHSAFLGRWRGYLGNIDAALLGGFRSEDWLIAGVGSAALFDAEVHAEAALFKVHEGWPDGALFDDDQLVAKMLLGGSYTFDWGTGLTLMGEYHYSGFGVRDTKDDLSQALDHKQFQTRLLRGDTQILGQHGLAGRLSYQFGIDWNTDLLLLLNPVDGSGLISPTAVYTVNDNVSITASLFIPWGETPKNDTLQSEYGATPASLFLQLSMYY